MATDDDYTEERLAEYDAAAIAQDDVIVMGFVTVVRNLRARIATLERELLAARAVVAQSRNVSPRICGAAGVLDETVKAYDAVVNKGQE